MARPTRRAVIVSAAAAAAATRVAASAALPAHKRTRMRGADADVIVIGAGVFGAWTAEHLRRAGQRVLLIDAWGPANARASSGGESRMTRGSYRADEVYTRMSLDSLAEWRRLSEGAGLPLFHRTGVLFFFPQVEPFLEETMRVHRRLGLPTELLDVEAMRQRFPQIDFTGIAAGLYEPQFGALMARRGVLTLVDGFVRSGGAYRQAQVMVPGNAPGTLPAITLATGEQLRAARFVFACGPWLGRVFPDILGRRIFPTRQEVFFFPPPPGDARFGPGRLPGWADFNGGDMFYGFPDLESRGFKIAHDKHGPPMDPDTSERDVSPAVLAEARAYMARRFPDLADRPLSEARVCQYENSSNGDFLIDRHPAWENVVLVGAGSGHGFKHGPAVGSYAAALALGQLPSAEPRFSLATKAETENRVVH